MVHWFQGSVPDGCLGDEVLTGDMSLGLISEVLGGVVIVMFSHVMFSHIARILHSLAKYPFGCDFYNQNMIHLTDIYIYIYIE